MPVRALISRLLAVFWLLCHASVSTAQASDPYQIANEYNANYLQAAKAQNRGDYATAEIWHQKNLILADSTEGIPPEVLVRSRYNLASAIMMQGRLEDAESVLKAAFEIVNANPHIHPEVIAFLLSNTGALKFEMNDFVAAEELLFEAVAIMEKLGLLSNAAGASALIELARAETQLGKFTVAKEHFEEGLRVLSDRGFTDANPYFLEMKLEYEALLKRMDSR